MIDNFHGAIDQFLKQYEPPFSVIEALHSLTDYAKEKGIEIKSGSINSEFKVGPVFELGYKGDPGWLQTASHDSSSWYFTYRLGYGDCPSGCTEWTTMKFRVFKDGAVMNLNTSIKSQLSSVNSYTSEKSAGPLYYYNLQGRQTGFRDLKSKTIMSSVFILSGNVNTLKNQAVKIK